MLFVKNDIDRTKTGAVTTWGLAVRKGGRNYQNIDKDITEISMIYLRKSKIFCKREAVTSSQLWKEEDGESIHESFSSLSF